MTEIKPINFKVVISAIAALMIIEVAALFSGQNGVMLSVIVGAICALAGLSLPQLKFK